jgi:hypothetical protein
MQSPTEDRRRFGSPENQNYGQNYHYRTKRCSCRHYGGPSRQYPRDYPDLPLGYLHNYACVVFTKLVRLFYANLEVILDDDCGMVLQSSVEGHVITVDPQIISQFIGVLVLQLSASPYNEVVLPPFLDDFKEFFQAVPQGEERATTIRISYLSAPHRMLSRIILHNLWPVIRRSDLILKKAQFVYAICLHLPFCLCKHILGVILEARDEGNTSLPFGCLLT